MDPQVVFKKTVTWNVGFKTAKKMEAPSKKVSAQKAATWKDTRTKDAIVKGVMIRVGRYHCLKRLLSKVVSWRYTMFG